MSVSSLDEILNQLNNEKPSGGVTFRSNKVIAAFLPQHRSTNSLWNNRVQPTRGKVEKISISNGGNSFGSDMGKKNRIVPQKRDGSPSDEDIEMQKLFSQGVDLEHIDNEKQQWKVLENIRALPCPLKVKFMIREKLFSGSVQSMSVCTSWKYHTARSWKRFKSRTIEFWHVIELWGGSFRSIEGHHGLGVLSYFVLLRWLFGLNFLLFLLVFGFVTVPRFFQPNIDYQGTSTDMAVNLSYYCTSQYSVNISSDAGQVVLDFFQGTGFMEQTSLFYGHYWGSQFLKGSGTSDTFVYNVPLAYILVSIVCLFISLFLMVTQTAESFRTSILDEHDTGFEYCNKVFGSWDFSFSDQNMAKLKHRSIFYDMASDLSEERLQKELAAKLAIGSKKCQLYTVRILINFFVLCCLGGGGVLIFCANKFSSRYEPATGTSLYILLLVQYLPSITITVLNALIPILFDIVVPAEKYTQAFVVKITLIRTVFLRLASLVVLVASLYTEISCEPRDNCQTSQAPCSVIQCWETYVGQQMYKLIILNFLVTVAKIFLVEFPRKLVVTKCKAKLFEKIGPPEFQIPPNVLDLVYTQTVCWLGFFFVPLLPVMVVLHLFIVFYCKKLSALFACEPTKRPYRAARSNSFFMIVLLLAFFLCCVPVLYTVSKLTPSKSCGPFRIYAQMFTVVQETVEAWHDVLKSIYDLLTSFAVVASLIVLLCLLVYYCSAMKGAHKEMNKVLKHQLTLEGQDMKFLISRLQELTGEKARRNPKSRGGRRGTLAAGPKDYLKSPADSQQVKIEQTGSLQTNGRRGRSIEPSVSPRYGSPQRNQTLDDL